MANEVHLKAVQDVRRWNKWRIENPTAEIDLSGADLTDLDLSGFLGERELSDGMVEMFYEGINLKSTNLSGASLRDALLMYADLRYANLKDASLSKTCLYNANLDYAILTNTDLSHAYMSETVLASNNLSKAKGLDSVVHAGPSTIGLDTLYLSGGNIPESFLRGCGVPDEFIAYIPSIIGAKQALQFYSCFISYSHKDEEFAKRLHSRLRDEHIRVWFAPEDIRGGQKLYEQIDHAIQIHDRLLIVLSENSIQSEWVKTEIRRARKVEIREGRQKLFPLRLIDFETIQHWECFDAYSGKDLAVELREYFTPDFSNWKDHDAFEIAFSKLLRDLRAAEKR